MIIIILFILFLDLKRLKLYFDFGDRDEVISSPIISHVSEIYGFAPLRQHNQLKVTIEGAHEDSQRSKVLHVF